VKTWTFRYRDRITGKVERKTLGPFPEILLTRVSDLADPDRVANRRNPSRTRSPGAPRGAHRNLLRCARRAISRRGRATEQGCVDACGQAIVSRLSARAEWRDRKAKDITRQDIMTFSIDP
jgi:hypothetical protein